MTRRLAAIMFTDITGFTSLTQTDEAAALRLVREQDRLVQPLLETHHGRKVKSMGDGLLIEFPDALDAVQCAVELERRAHERNSREGVIPLRIRVGIHLGDIQRRGTDIFGDAVNIASRVQPLANPEGVCLSSQVWDQVRSKLPYGFDNLGPQSLRGIREAVGVYRVKLPWAKVEGPAEIPALPRVAVLPLTNISPDSGDEYFADGLTEELITVLSQIRGLRVISRTSVSFYKGSGKPLKQIGGELGVSSVLEGSVRKSGNHLRITVQLVDVQSDEHRWAQTYDRELENVFAIQAEVAERTAAALKVELLKPEREVIQETPTANLTAYELYLRGLQAYRRSLSDPGFEAAAIRFFERAIQEDPKFSAPCSCLATLLIGTMGNTRPAREILPRARELLERLLDLAPDSWDTHLARGNLAMQGDLDWSVAEDEFQRAISLNPSSSTAHFWYGFLLVVLQRFDEAIVQFHQAIDLDPLWLLPKINLASALTYAGDWQAAISLTQRLVKSREGSPWARVMLGWAYALAGRVGDAINAVQPVAADSDLRCRQARMSLLAVLGKPEEAERWLAEWTRSPPAGYVALPVVAYLYASVGQKEMALDVLEKDFREGDRTLWNSYFDEGFDSIRKDPRFVAMLKSMNLPERTPPRRDPPVTPASPST